MREPLLRRLALCLLAFFLCLTLPWTFCDLALLGFCVLASSYLAATTRTRPVRWITSAGALGMAVTLLLLLPEALPLQARVRGARFENAPLAEVLRYVALQKTTAPYWRFYLVDEPTSRRRISVTLRESASLREALDVIATASDCNYRWNWHKACGKELRGNKCLKFRAIGLV